MIYGICEGQQAEEYKARKAKEKEDAAKAQHDRDLERYGYDSNKSVNLYKPAGSTRRSNQFFRMENEPRKYDKDGILISTQDKARSDYVDEKIKDRKKALDKEADKAVEDSKAATEEMRAHLSTRKPILPGSKRKEYNSKTDELAQKVDQTDNARHDTLNKYLDFDRGTKGVYMRDAYNRHIRRHPNQYPKELNEFGIFESIIMI